MTRTVLLALWAAAASAGAAPEEAGRSPARRFVRSLPVGEAVVVETAVLRESTVYEVICEDRRVSVLVTGEGVVQCLETSHPAGLIAVGRQGNYVVADLVAGEAASAWPVERVVVYAGRGRFMMSGTSADWAVSVRCDRSVRGGVPVRADGRPLDLRPGMRLDAAMEDGRVVFRQTTSGAPGAGGPPRAVGRDEELWRDVPAGETMRLDPLALSRPAVWRLSAAGKTVALRLTPDGLAVLSGGEQPVMVEARGADGSLAILDLVTDEHLSVWPVDAVAVRYDAGVFTVKVEAASWTFVLRAEATRPGGLPVSCDGVPVKLSPGERLDVFRREQGLAWRRTAAGWAGETIVEKERPPAHVRGVGTYVADVGPTRVVPGVMTNPHLSHPWQVSQLTSLMRWEFESPPVVSW